ncbi:hypothetical protein ACHAXA_011068 [Cyclostephanos tholiformis]|uniref:Arf-GAP domain-containing protein n=1 Tax=Cyclostephanos tholiformis TaxID=382380 RepID=A0ABD3RVS7_9STRA
MANDDPPRPLPSDRLRKIRSLPGNDTCVECCGSVYPDWASITYGTLLCIHCAGIHRGLGVHISSVKSLTLDSWNDDQYIKMIRGGNARFWKRMGYHHRRRRRRDDDGGGWITTVRSSYEGDAARIYRDRLSVVSIEDDDDVNDNDDDDDDDDDMIMTTTAPPGYAPVDGRENHRRPPSVTRDFATSDSGGGESSSRDAYYDLIVRASRSIFMRSWRAKLTLTAYVILVGASTKMITAVARRGRRAIVTATMTSSSSSLPRVNPAAAISYQATMPPPSVIARHNLDAVVIFLCTTFAFVVLPWLLVRTGARKLASKWHDNRQEAFDSAKVLLADLVKNGRARRMKSCDAYYPPPPPTPDGDGTMVVHQRTARCGLVFYPGALVDGAAYAHVASLLSDMGVLVAVVNLEPHRLVLTTADYPLRETTMRAMCDSMLSTDLGTWTVDEWAVGGHSLGGALAMTVVANELHSTVKRVVLWGVMSYPHPSVYPGPPLRDIDGVHVLVVNGSEDGIINSMGGGDKSTKFEESMPPRSSALSSSTMDAAPPGNDAQGQTLFVTIRGGNHSGFADYGPQTYPVQDGTRTITLYEQQCKTAEVTADFLFGRCDRGSRLKSD